MKTTRRWASWCLAGLGGLALAAQSGCQTWVAGMTLPSERYLDHPPQYFLPSPPFPLYRELASQEAAAAAAAGAVPGPAVPLPPPVVVPAPVPAAPPPPVAVPVP
jgi:hypothetical protein